MAEAATYPNEHIIRTRTIEAPASAIFTVLSDPTRHRETEPTDWVRDAIDAEPISGPGQLFSMNMHFDRDNCDYRIANTGPT
ncbi:MAG: ATPase, partial [Brevibacterium sp.]|nr:ATPase [Brevibacterium sp.]